MIYLDHNATTPLHPSVKGKMMDLLDKNDPANPSSIHLYGRNAKSLLESSRKSIAKLLGFDKCFADYQTIFTSTGTEANNLIISNFKDADIFISETEHPSILSHSKFLPNIQLIKVDSSGYLNLEDLEEKLKKSTSEKKLVSVMLANNETGIIQKIKDIASIVHKHGALIHSDMIQAIGKINVDLVKLDIDFATISGHKFGGPLGAAALIARTSKRLNAMIVGGGQEKSMRSGTENLLSIVGFGEAANMAYLETRARASKMKELRNYLESELLKNYNDIDIIGLKSDRLPNTTMFTRPGRNADTLMIALDLKGVAISSGSACSSGKIEPSHVLLAMGVNESKTNSALRISLGYNTSKADIDNFLTIYNEINKK